MPDLPGNPAWVARLEAERVRQQLEQFPAVALLGPPQVGKTTLAPPWPSNWRSRSPASTSTWRRPPIGPAWRNRRCFWRVMPTSW